MMTKCHFQSLLPKEKDLVGATGACAVLIVDQSLLSRKAVQKWVGHFRHVVAVASGEELKSLDLFPRIVRAVLDQTQGFAPNEIVLVAVGGGSVGDMVGFLASVLKRGVRLVHVPSTWLSAMDSAHGGKTALNVGERKNQIGTIYPAEKVFLVRSLLFGQPEINLRSGLGEAFKMALLHGKKLFRTLHETTRHDEALLWKLLPELIAAKMAVVQKDPFEKKGRRIVLNLGHTLGHAIELESKIPHGVAVQLGLSFALDFSREKNLISAVEYKKAKDLVQRHLSTHVPVLSKDAIRQQILHDKKATNSKDIHFVFLKKIGRPLVQKIPIQQFIDATGRLGWAR